MEWFRALTARMLSPFTAHPDELRPLVQKKQEVERDKRTRQSRVYYGYALLILGIAAGGVAILSISEDWTILTTLYVLAQIITTIGFGDFTVNDEVAQVLMGCYALIVLVVLAHFVNTLLHSFVLRQEHLIQSHLRRLSAMTGQASQHGEQPVEDDIMDKAHDAHRRVIVGLVLFIVYLLMGTLFYRFTEHCTCRGGPTRLHEGCDPTSYHTCVATGGAVKDFSESFYMSVITLSTVGFGDYQPRTQHGRIFGLFFMTSGVAVTAMFFSAISHYFFDRDHHHHLHAQEFMVHIHEKEFKRMDYFDTGYLTRAEFLVYTLRKYGGVSEELLEQIWLQYDKVDPGGKGITLEMLRSQQDALKVMKEASWQEGGFA